MVWKFKVLKKCVLSIYFGARKCEAKIQKMFTLNEEKCLRFIQILVSGLKVFQSHFSQDTDVKGMVLKKHFLKK